MRPLLLDTTGTDVDTVAMERLKGTVIGITFTLIVMLLLWPLVRHLEARPGSRSVTSTDQSA